jgi:flagellar protein FlbD
MIDVSFAKPSFPYADVSPQGSSICLARHSLRKGRDNMIQLTRLNNKALTVNSDLIKFVEQSPDTLVTLITGEKLVVLENAGEIVARIIDFRRSVLRGLSLTWDPSSAHALIARSPNPGGREPER